MNDIRLLTRKQLEDLLGWSKSSIYLKMDKDEFQDQFTSGEPSDGDTLTYKIM